MATTKITQVKFSGKSSKPIDLPDALPWVEKYRPKSVDEVVFQDEVTQTLRKALETGNLPHLLFYGPPGTGKTSTILAIALQLYGPEEKQNRVLEHNASDERGINVVRTKVKDFASLTAKKEDTGKYPCPAYKIAILDEADLMTVDAQNALRRVIEQYSRTTRFCLICNYVSRIIEPLASRCAKFRFKPLATDGIASRLKFIADQEKVILNDDVLNEICKVSGGDMRKAITTLHSAYRLFGDEVDVESISVISGTIPEKDVKEVFDACKSNSFARIQVIANKVIMDGYSAAQFFDQFQDFLAANNEVASEKKSVIMEALGEADSCLADGADEFLQLLNVCAITMKALSSNPK